MNEKIPPEELDALASKIWGKKWAAPMARALGVHLQTIYVWRREGANPDTLTPLLARWLIAHRAALDGVETFILRHVAAQAREPAPAATE